MCNKITAGLSGLLTVENIIVREIAFQVRHLLLHVAYLRSFLPVIPLYSQEDLNWFLKKKEGEEPFCHQNFQLFFTGIC
jgi:hypothetical protein